MDTNSWLGGGPVNLLRQNVFAPQWTAATTLIDTHFLPGAGSLNPVSLSSGCVHLTRRSER